MARIPFDRYRALDAVNWSRLKNMRDSPLAYHHALTAPDNDTPARLLGRATHTLTLEPALFDEEYAVFEGERRAGPEWKAFQAANVGREILKAGELDGARTMAAAVRSHPLVRPYLDGAAFEQSIRWVDGATGLGCKARVDWLVGNVLGDLKTTNTIDGRRFGNLAARMGYHCQLAHYRNGLRANGIEINETVIIAVESDAPYDVGVFVVDEDAMQAGAEEVATLMGRLAECIATDRWPGRYDEQQALQLPFYVFADDNDADDLGVTAGGVAL